MEWLCNIDKMQDTCVAFGSFDGVHKGHIAVAEALVNESQKRACKSVILSCVDEEENVANKVMTTEEEKAYFLKKSGLDVLISYSTKKASLDAETFIHEIIIGTLGAKAIIVGEENKNLELLTKICGREQVDLVIVEAVKYNGENVTGNLVRKAFMECRFEDVTGMCEHTYVMIGKVEHGKALGRTVGMPTANLGVAKEKLMPPSGVYATVTDVEGEVFKGLTNIGTRPSVDSMSYITIETFLLDFSKDIYDKKLVMEVHLYIRGVQKFDSLDKVQEQVQKDLTQVKEYLDSTSLTYKVGA